MFVLENQITSSQNRSFTTSHICLCWKIKEHHLRIEVLQLHTYVCVGKSKNIMAELKFYDPDLRFHVPTHGGWKVINMLLMV